MKVKRLLALMLVFTLLGATTLFATEFERYTAKKVSIMVNGTSINGLEVDMVKGGSETKVMVPLEDIVNSIGGIVSMDESNGINVYKPNVQMSVITPKELKAIQYVEKGKEDLKLPFRIFGVMDSVKTEISNIKITVIDPFGDEIESKIESLAKEDQTSEIFQYTSRAYEVNMKYTGKYTVNLQLKEATGDKYYLVGQIAIYAVSN
jgi:hypothetical protein